MVARASGVEENAYNTKSIKGMGVAFTSTPSGRTKNLEKAKSSSQRRTNAPLIIRDEEVDVEENDKENIESNHEEFDEEKDDFVELNYYGLVYV